MRARIVAKWALLLSSAGTLLLAVLLSFTYALLTTQAGSRWLVNQALGFQNNKISWQSIEGTLMDGIKITEVQASLPDLELSANTLSGKWDLLSFLGGQFQIEQLYAKDLLIINNDSTEAPTNTPWPTINSPFPVNINDLSLDQIRIRKADSETRIETIRFSGIIGLLTTQIKKLNLRQDQQWLEVSGKLGARPPYKLDLNLRWQATLSDGKTLDGISEIKGDLAEIKLKHRSTAPFQLGLSGLVTTDFNPKKMALDWKRFTSVIDAHWQIENWQAPTYQQSISSTGQLSLNGTVNDYRANGQFDLTTDQTTKLPKLQITLNANGDMETIRFQQLSIKSDSTNIHGQGKVSWQQDLTWNLALNGDKINPGYFWPDWAGEITTSLRSQGSFTAQGLTLEAQIEQMTGTLRGYPLSASGKIGYHAGVFSATGFQLKQGDNQLVLDAAFDQAWQASWTLTANDLAAIYPGLKGQARSQGTLAGSILHPQFNAEIMAQSLTYDDIVINSLTANLSSQDNDTYQLRLDAVDLVSGSQLPTQISLSAVGTQAAHHYDFSAKQADLALLIKGSGTWHQQQWQTELATADINSETLGQWQLTQPTHLRVQKTQANLSSTCWQRTNNEVCFEVSYATQTGVNLAATIHRLQLATMNHQLPEDTQINGELKGAITLSGPLDNLTGELNLATDNARLMLNPADGKPNQIQLHAINIAALLKDHTLSLNAKGQLLETGFAEAHLLLPLTKLDTPLSGKLIAQFNDLSWLDPFVVFLSDLNGEADITIQLAGTRKQPLITGSANLEKLSAFVPRLGVNLRNGTLTLNNQHLRDWTITGQLDSGEGSVHLDGAATLNSLTDWQGHLAVEGKDLQTLELENIKALISPNLVFDAAPKKLKIQGNIEIPQAKINLKELPPSTVSVSKDEVILDSRKTSEQQPSTLAIYTDIKLILGKQVAFKGFGVTGELTGSLRLREAPERLLRIDGIVEIPEGFYQAYGQKLTINPGRFIFQGSPENPAIDVRASRQVDEIVVGIQIGGTAEALSSELYAIPPLPPTETMALLITGKPLNSATQADASVLMSAVASLGITQSAGLTQRLQRSFGLDVLSLSSNGGIEQSAVTIGKYLTPKLFISYVQDILTPNASVNLEYSLSEKLKVKAESGTSQSMDILYRIER